jgi:hypothetical protein
VSPHPVIPPLTITTPGIQKLLDNINPHKASGPDNISGRILKDLQNFTAPILTIIFQKSLQTECIPSDWKHADVAPAYKKGEKYNAANYRLVRDSSAVRRHYIFLLPLALCGLMLSSSFWMPGVVMVSGGITGCGLTPLLGMLHFIY